MIQSVGTPYFLIYLFILKNFLSNVLQFPMYSGFNICPQIFCHSFLQKVETNSPPLILCASQFLGSLILEEASCHAIRYHTMEIIERLGVEELRLPANTSYQLVNHGIHE